MDYERTIVITAAKLTDEGVIPPTISVDGDPATDLMSVDLSGLQPDWVAADLMIETTAADDDREEEA